MRCCIGIMGHIDNTRSIPLTAMSSALLPSSSGLADSSIEPTSAALTVSSSNPTGPRYLYTARTRKILAN